MRLLNKREELLILFLLSKFDGFDEFKKNISTCVVQDMSDGGMGSIRFWHEEKREFSSILIECECTDEDGVCIVISLNLDRNGDLFEMDLWKTNFLPLNAYPDIKNVKFKNMIM